MAKWGEGDPRWLVEERPDATNPNNWHWVEKNATPWSKDRLTELFIGKTIDGGAIKINLLEFSKIEGEASANNRKAKLIFLFEWVLHIKFNAFVAGSETEYKGLLEIPNLSDENESSEVDVSVSIETKGPHEPEIRFFLSKDGLKFVRLQCETYIQELKKEFSKGLILPTDKTKPQTVIAKSKTASVVNKKDFQNQVISSKSVIPSNQTKVSSVQKLNLSETFKVQPERLYDILTNPELVKKWGGSDVILENKENGAFSLIGNQISGFFMKLIENQDIVMKWRLKKYPEGHFAIIKFTLKDQNDCTELLVEADYIPDEYLNDTQFGIVRYYFQTISRTFGIGLNLF